MLVSDVVSCHADADAADEPHRVSGLPGFPPEYSHALFAGPVSVLEDSLVRLYSLAFYFLNSSRAAALRRLAVLRAGRESVGAGDG